MEQLPIWVLIILFVVFILTPAFLLWAGVKVIKTTLKFNKEAFRVRGTVVSVKEVYSIGNDDNNKYTYHPTYEYEAPDGTKHRGETAAGGANWNYPAGRQDDIMVNPNDMSTVRYPGPAHLIMGVLLLAFAAIFFGGGVFMVVSVLTGA